MAKKKETAEAAITEAKVKTADMIKKILMKIDREGMEDLIDVMEEKGFFTAPASSSPGKHSAEEGGLARHSLNVLLTAEKLSVALIGGANITKEFRQSLELVCLIHDLGKCGDHGKPLYVPNILKSGKQSDAKPWERNKDLTNIPHATRSVLIATRWIDLTEEEEYAIMYHDGLYDRETGGMAVVPGHESKLLMILHWADMWSARITEATETAEEKEGE